MSATAFQLRAPARLRTASVAEHIRRRPALTAGLIILLLAWPALVIAHRSPKLLPLSKPAIVADLRAGAATSAAMRRLRWNRLELTSMDARHEVLWLLDGPRLVLSAIVTRSGGIEHAAVTATERYAYGSNIANDWRVLALMTAVFVLMSAVWPLRRLRNLDVLVAAGTVSATPLLNAGLLEPMALAAYPALLYLAIRCGLRALRPGPVAPSTPLFDQLTRSWSPDQRLRTLRLVALALAAIVAMVGISSTRVVDVGYAVMEGATAILHGVIPYGHVGGIPHGDTYPIGSYLAYVPFAALTPVRDLWDTADLTLAFAVAAALLSALAVRAAALPHGIRSAAERARGLRAAIAFLSFPALLVTVSTGTTDVALGAILLGAILLYRRPAASSSLLAAGAWFKLAPAALLPLWLAPLRGRRLLAALAGAGLVSAALLALLLALGGSHALAEMVHAIGYQNARDSLNGLWGFLGSVPLQQLAQAATLALIAGGALRLRYEPTLAADRSRLAALCAAVLLGLELSAGYWTYMYLLWVLPFLALSVLTPAGDAA